MIRCPKCGNPVSSGTKYCDNCGEPIGARRKPQSAGCGSGCAVVLCVFVIVGVILAYCGRGVSLENESGSDSKSTKENTAAENETTENIAENTYGTESIYDVLVDFGYTEEQAETIQDQLYECGIEDFSNFYLITNPEDAKPEGLVTFMNDSDPDISLWVVIDAGELYYVGLNGNDVYDSENGGLITKVSDVEIPESEIPSEVKSILKEKATEDLDSVFFANDIYPYYDGWGCSRRDELYAVQCNAYEDPLGSNDSYFCKLIYTESEDGEFTLTEMTIDGSLVYSAE